MTKNNQLTIRFITGMSTNLPGASRRNGSGADRGEIYRDPKRAAAGGGLDPPSRGQVAE